MEPMTPSLYTSRILKATALIADTKTLLASWDLSKTSRENLEHARQINVFGKASRARVEDILTIFRQRYFNEPEIGTALVALVQGNVPGQWLDPLLYYYSVQNDITLRDIVLLGVAQRRMSGHTDFSPEHLTSLVRDWVAEGKTTSTWGEETITRVVRNSIAALRDFGILEGKVNKSITPLYLPVESFAFLAFEMWRKLRSGDKVLHSPDWNLFFLPTQGVERFFLEAHQERLLTYHAAGSVIRLEFDQSSLLEVAHALVERTR
jgi:hypothetical protein